MMKIGQCHRRCQFNEFHRFDEHVHPRETLSDVATSDLFSDRRLIIH